MTIGGREFTSDLIIHSDGRIQDNWRRTQGHYLVPDDIITVFDAPPEKLIIGTGASGLMSISESMIDLCEKQGIEVEAYRTAAAVAQFNEAVKTGTTIVACFHLTC